MSSRLRELIKSIRECKTAAEERAVVAKESASLRASFKSDSVESRHRNVAKLMYLHMLGYPTHFGQMECLKLIAANGFPEKRIGYLGLMALLDEKQEVLMLVTNSLKSDLHHKNQYIVGLALCALGSICSVEMARDLAPDVKALMKSSTIYIKKKAAVCAIRLAQKVPELVEDFKQESLNLLDERSHGVLLGAVTLALEICSVAPEAIEWYRGKTYNIIKMLKHLTTSGFASADHQVRGVPDPFLQVKILHLLRLLGKGNAELSDAMGDVLAQVATNTDSSKNVGNSILYECAQTIIETESIGGLRVLAVNILGKFLANRDNNIRYVALHTLTKVVAIDAQAVQRHKNVIVQCVKDADISIRKRALELACALVNPSNIEAFMKELLEFLTDSDAHFKPELVQKVSGLVEKFSPTPRWHVDVMTEVLEKAGLYVEDHAMRAFVVMVSTTPTIQAYAVRKLYRVLFDNMDKAAPSLLMVSLWCIGEFGSQLLSGQDMQEGEIPLKANDSEVVSMIEQLMKVSSNHSEVMEYALTALVKLSDRYTGQSQRIQTLIAKFKKSSFLELQQRSCEFDKLFSYGKLRPQLLETMPPMMTEDDEGPGEGNNTATNASTANGGASSLDPTGDLLDLTGGQTSVSGGDALADLLGDTSLSAPATSTPAEPAGGLLDMLGGAPPVMQSQPQDALADLMGGASFAPVPAASAPSYPNIVVYQKNGLSIEFAFEKPPNQPATTVINGTYKNSGSGVVNNFLLQAAVPKFIQLRLEAASGNTLPPNGAGQVNQRITVTNSMHGQKQLMMRLKVDFVFNGTPCTEMVEVKNFPAGL